jgi:hypothetical protein
MANLYSDRIKPSKLFSGRNAIINGNFTFWQRGASFNPVVSNTYTSDRWKVEETNDGTFRVDREQTIKPNDDVNYTLKATVVTGDSSLAATQYAHVFQRIEGNNYVRFIGRTATLSFWVRSSVTGTYSVTFRNGTAPYAMSYPTEYTINNANTWEYKTITVKFDYTGGGTWNITTGTGIDVLFSLGCGSTYSGTPGQWTAANLIASTNQVNWMATVGNTFYLSNVQFELGSNASPFELIDVGLNKIQCLRYYESKYYYSQVTQTATGAAGYAYNVYKYWPKRANPTVTNGGDLTMWGVSAWYNATNVGIWPYLDRMLVRYDDTAGHSWTYGAHLTRGTFYMDSEL